MKTLYMFKGLPGSGKSTVAREMLAHFGPGNAHRVNKDDLRAMLDDGKWTGPNEKFVLHIRDAIIVKALEDGKHILVDDTNLAPKHEVRLRQLAHENEALFSLIDQSDISVEECIKRDLGRFRSVGSKVIQDMYEQFLAPAPVEPPPHDPMLPDAIICDVDGTVAQMNGRTPFDWDKVGTDQPRKIVLDVLRKMWGPKNLTRPTVIFVSGREEVCRNATTTWLCDFVNIPSDEWLLFMRPTDDHRSDQIIKREIYERAIKGKYNVLAIFDDRPRVIREWQVLGFSDRIFNVGPGKEF